MMVVTIPQSKRSICSILGWAIFMPTLCWWFKYFRQI